MRNEKELFQKDLGKKVDVGQNSIAMYESCKARPSFKVLLKLAEILDASTYYLLGKVDFK